MDVGVLLKAILMGIVEGFTEFIPVSSTGHLILVGSLLRFHSDEVKVFEVVIQTGAMFAIIWDYRERLTGVLRGLTSERRSQRFVFHLAVAFLPAALLGIAFGSEITRYLFRPIPVALAFIVGGVVILWAERRKHVIRITDIDDMSWRDALKIGCAQCLALIPGTSRAGATIIGGLLFGFSRTAATEFSFFLAVPTLIGAGAYQLYRQQALLTTSDLYWFAAGSIAAFASAAICVRWFLRYVSTHDFSLFAWYRIVFGVAVLVTAYSGLVSWTAN